ncbi:MAG: PQQ-dependent sugar dehydrogenase [Microscillaceae bacterium]|nr:PQQ-dependent sugar dehydrogenase [Microscillaceae bacterium]
MHFSFIQRKKFFLLFLLGIALSAGFYACSRITTANQSVSEKPEDNRFTKVVLTEGMDEPMAMTFLSDGRVLIVERKGGVKAFDTKTNQIKTITTIPVNTKYKNKEGVEREAEEGLMGVIAHPKFAENNWVYLYYADPTDAKHILARWELHGDSLYENTKKIILEVPTQREVCCHTGGGMAFDKEGNLFLTVGNNAANPQSGTFSSDERPGRRNFDDQAGAGNTNDLRGAILRIHPEDTGSYTIPEGNLFPQGTPKTKPEIYIKGNRNAWRVSVDDQTGYIYWGEVGPDASVDSIYGSRGYDEFNQAKKPGYFGWPYFIGDNQPYRKFNYADSTYGELTDPAKPINNSPNNTGLTELPPAQKPMIWYPYAISEKFPMLGSSGRSAVGGPVFRKANFKNAKRPWPDYYEGKWIITDFMRGWLIAVTMDEQGNYKSMEQILPNENFSSVIDMQFNPDGDLYILEYGSAWFKGNPNSRLVRVEYNAGNRVPIVEAKAAKTSGAVPFKVKLSSEGTKDYDPYDQDALKYSWTIKGNNIDKSSTEPNPEITLDKPGVYEATLTVTDSKGDKNSKSIQLIAGNESPEVKITLLKGNQSFFFPDEAIEYAIEVTDQEDGSTTNGKIKSDLVAVNFDYMPEGFDPIEILQNHRSSDLQAGFSVGQQLIAGSDCKSCHIIDKPSVGPSFKDIAAKYQNDATAKSNLAQKIIKGSAGVWGDHAMSAHPNVSQADAEKMVSYILSLAKKPTEAQNIPLKGTYTMKAPEGDNGKGGILLRAAYTDKGGNKIPTLSAENIIFLRNSNLEPQHADFKKNVKVLITPRVNFSLVGSEAHIGYKQLDMTGIKQINVYARARQRSGDLGATVEVRLDSPTGKLLGTVEIKVSSSTEWNRRPPQPEIVPVQGIQGKHDVYLVAKNPKAPANYSLMQLIGLEFLNKEMKPEPEVPPVQ